MPPESQLEVRFPIKPTVDQGTIEILISATTQIRSDTESIEVEILVRKMNLEEVFFRFLI